MKGDSPAAASPKEEEAEYKEEEAEYLDRARGFIDAKITEHLEILRRKFLQTRIFDDYGNWIPDRFFQEVEHFKAKVLVRDWPNFYAANRESAMMWWWETELNKRFDVLMASYVQKAILQRVQSESTAATSSPVRNLA
jgi:hypothetical protein